MQVVEREARIKCRELLPIVAIILILLPILSCTVRHAREASEQQTCTENLKRLGVACEMYQADWEDVLVPYGMPFVWNNRSMWYELLDRYIRKIPDGRYNGANLPPEYRCPSSPAVGFQSDRTYGININCGGAMSMTQVNSGQATVVPLTRVKYPQATIRIAEVMWLAAGGGSAFAVLPTEYAPGDPACRQFPEWHNGKGNVLCIDGHVSTMTRDQYNTRDNGVYSGQIWLRLEGPKPALP